MFADAGGKPRGDRDDHARSRSPTASSGRSSATSSRSPSPRSRIARSPTSPWPAPVISARSSGARRGQKAAEELADGHHGQALIATACPRRRARLEDEAMKQRFLRRPSTLEVGGRAYEIHRLDALQEQFDVARLPYSLKVLLENVLRLEDGESVSRRRRRDDRLLGRRGRAQREIPFQPARVLMQDFTGVPAVVDLAAMRDAMDELGGDPAKINPLVAVDLVIDHSVQVDAFGNARAFAVNAEREFERNQERYEFLRWGQQAFDNFRVVPPATGICHQVNLEYLAQVVYSRERDGALQAYPDTLVGTDSHTTMVNGLGVLGWGVGGIEAEAAMLGQPISMLLPQVIGFKLDGELPEGATATDLVLTVTEMLRERGVVGKFVEFFGPGLPTLGSPTGRRSATCRPSSARPARSSRSTPRRCATWSSPAARPRRSSWSTPTPASRACSTTPTRQDPTFSDTLELDLGDVEPSIAGPKRPQDRMPLTDAKAAFLEALEEFDAEAAEKLGNGATRRSTSPSRPPTRRPRTTTTSAASRGPAIARRRRGGRRAGSERRGRGDARGRQDVRARPRPRRDRRDHQLHQHLEPVGDGRRRPARQEGGRARPDAQALGEDLAGAGLDRGHRLPREGRPDEYLDSSGSTSSATAARPASATRARCRRRSRRRSTRRTSSSARCSPATATSRAGSTRTSRPTTSPPRRCASPTRWPAAWTST